jgi:hypothetical protein
MSLARIKLGNSIRVADRSSLACICPEINGGPSNSFGEETSAVRPRKLPYKPVIGELENRTEYGS